MKARSRNSRQVSSSTPKGSGAPPAPEVALRPHDRDSGSRTQPPPLPSDSRVSANATERSHDTAWALVFGCWVIASVSSLGALFFGEVMDLPPCVLCWYQRIFMFPLVLILPLGLFPFDRKIIRYALPLALGGWVISVFHLLLVYGVIPETVTPCTQGVPCKDVQIQWLGFVTIPLLSFVAFSLIVALMLAARPRISK